MIMKSKRLFYIFRHGGVRQQILPLLVWMAAVVGVGMLFYHGSQRLEVVGIAQSQVAQVCSPVDGRLKTVYVKLFDNVTKGQPVASLDDELLTAKIATVSATAAQLRSRLVPAQEQLLANISATELNRAEEQRRFAVDVERARLDILGIKAQIAADRVALENYASEVKISTDLLTKNAIAPYELDKAKALYEALAKKVEQTEIQQVQAQEQLKVAQLRQDAFIAQKYQTPSVDAALDAMRKEVAVQEKLLDELEIQRRALVITAPIDGTVVQILARVNDAASQRTGDSVLHRPGEVVMAGQPILVIAQDKPKEIIAYAKEGQLGQIAAGAKVVLVKNTIPAQIAQSEVASIGPVVEQMPARLWLNPNVPQWGQPFLIKVPDGMELTPGEIVGIRRL
jgi:multidrug resistance efflux pump